MTQISAVVVGGTGLVGSNILAAIASNPAFQAVHAIARKQLPSYTNVHPVIEADSSKWSSSLRSISPPPNVLFSALGTTRGQAGSLEKQRQVDVDLNLELARQAKAAGTQVYVLISTASASSGSLFPYTKMKGELEDEVKKLGFEFTVIVRPGLLLGQRSDFRAPEFVLQVVARALGKINKTYLVDSWSQEASVVGRAAVVAGQQCVEGKREKGIWVVDQAQVLQFGRL